MLVAKDCIGSENETGLLISARSWPLLAARMADIARGPRAGLMENTDRRLGPPSELLGVCAFSFMLR